MTKLSIITQMKQKADVLVALADTLWERCYDEYDVHCVPDAEGNCPASVLDDMIAAELIAKEMETLRANMDDWDFDYGR